MQVQYGTSTSIMIQQELTRYKEEQQDLSNMTTESTLKTSSINCNSGTKMMTDLGWPDLADPRRGTHLVVF